MHKTAYMYKTYFNYKLLKLKKSIKKSRSIKLRLVHTGNPELLYAGNYVVYHLK